ncbi:hypothetical protein SH528x_004496 [Novipirellula sp. SH528]|uniref:hypothetical protein n=1 Tax=Novipirellula sp. SH528 TaxID=3454466 RepID=UPI003FA0B7FC
MQPNWRFDYLCLFDSTLNCAETDLELRESIHNDYAGYVSRVHRLDPCASAGAVVTPDGQWHDLSDFGYRLMNDADSNAEPLERWHEHYWKLMRDNPDCWVIETWAHS